MSIDRIKQFLKRPTLWDKVAGGLILAAILGAIGWAMSINTIKQFLVRPIFVEVLIGLVILASIPGAIWFAWLLIGKARNSVRSRAMSPREDRDLRNLSPRNSGETKLACAGIENGSSKVSPEPEYLNYKSDNVWGINWHWEYTGGRLDIDNLVPRCPRCESFMRPAGFSENGRLDCTGCGYTKQFRSGYTKVFISVFLEIQRKIETGQFKGTEPPM